MEKENKGFTVQDAIDILNTVEDKSREITLYASTDDPGMTGVLEVFGVVYDIDINVLKEDKVCNDVVVSAVVTDTQISRGYTKKEEAPATEVVNE